MYCLRCKLKKNTETVGRYEVTAANGRRCRGGLCAMCGARKYQFVGTGLMNKLINRQPVERNHHDLCYANHKDTGNFICDKTMLEFLDKIPNPPM